MHNTVKFYYTPRLAVAEMHYQATAIPLIFVVLPRRKNGNKQ